LHGTIRLLLSERIPEVQSLPVSLQIDGLLGQKAISVLYRHFDAGVFSGLQEWNSQEN
jgi:hydroxylamine reductase (hybrid-cluster protein)